MRLAEYVDPTIMVVDHIPLGKRLVTLEGYLLYCTKSEQYLTYVDSKLSWRGEPVNLFLSENFDVSPMKILMLTNDIQIFIGEELYQFCVVVPSVFYSRELKGQDIIKVYLTKDFRRSFPWKDIAPWNRQ